MTGSTCGDTIVNGNANTYGLESCDNGDNDIIGDDTADGCYMCQPVIDGQCGSASGALYYAKYDGGTSLNS